MARGLAKLGLALGAGLLTAVMAAGPALAGPTPSADDRPTATESDGSKVPAPTRVGTTPTQPKNEGNGQTVGRALSAHLDGTCNIYSSGTGDLCLWYFSGYGGSHVDYYFNDYSFWNDVFLSAGTGKGAVVANNSESAFNYDRIWIAWVYTSTNCSGTGGYILPWTGGNFVPTFFNNSESLCWT